jgi:hypothetical protein
MHHEALRRGKPDSLLSVDVLPGHWVEEEVLGLEGSFCPDESLCSGEVLSPDRARFRGESLFPAEGHSQGEAHSPSQTHLVDEAPRDVVLQSSAARSQGEKGCSPFCSLGREQWRWGVVELRDSQKPRTVLRTGWPLRPRGR